MKVMFVVGARPNFVKTAPVIAALGRMAPDVERVVVHTGQHYDREMSDVFLSELGVPDPDHMLGVGSGTHAVQTARVMERIEPVIEAERPDVVLVPGDVNSTLAAALVATKLGVRVGHIESGLRSFDRTMPEEINRIVADQIAELLFVHSEEAVDTLEREGVIGSIHFVGNTMIDTLVALEDRFREARYANELGLQGGDYLLVTLHRPALVDGPLLSDALRHLAAVASHLPVVFPVHPRTRKMIEAAGVVPAGVVLTEPLGYIDFLSLQADAAAVLTDSGGVQEETTYLGVRCFTLRDTTERPVTLRLGTNTLLGLEPERIAEIPDALSREIRGELPPLWDGRASERLADVLVPALAGT